MAAFPEDAERILAEHSEDLAKLSAVLHGPAGGFPQRPVWRREYRFTGTANADRLPRPRPAAPIEARPRLFTD
ncbi:hypothetical protein MMMDOFMJ_2959 [Methylobacterium gnaphalii]|nr:hypothetical protein MMMDOFMJ_2959 [Methylobacterium gnaphalii]